MSPFLLGMLAHIPYMGSPMGFLIAFFRDGNRFENPAMLGKSINLFIAQQNKGQIQDWEFPRIFLLQLLSFNSCKQQDLILILLKRPRKYYHEISIEYSGKKAKGLPIPVCSSWDISSQIGTLLIAHIYNKEAFTYNKLIYIFIYLFISIPSPLKI